MVEIIGRKNWTWWTILEGMDILWDKSYHWYIILSIKISVLTLYDCPTCWPWFTSVVRWNVLFNTEKHGDKHLFYESPKLKNWTTTSGRFAMARLARNKRQKSICLTSLLVKKHSPKNGLHHEAGCIVLATFWQTINWFIC